MKKIIQVVVLLAAIASLNSCGVAEVLGRTAGRVFDGVGNAAGKAMTTGL
ncbi:MAG: hypothetical protein HC767_09615 [Akkermansiaceae bacterium]|nr:hypothetical protein [Akkermansiaceae bacterium]